MSLLHRRVGGIPPGAGLTPGQFWGLFPVLWSPSQRVYSGSWIVMLPAGRRCRCSQMPAGPLSWGPGPHALLPHMLQQPSQSRPASLPNRSFHANPLLSCPSSFLLLILCLSAQPTIPCTKPIQVWPLLSRSSGPMASCEASWPLSLAPVFFSHHSIQTIQTQIRPYPSFEQNSLGLQLESKGFLRGPTPSYPCSSWNPSTSHHRLSSGDTGFLPSWTCQTSEPALPSA